VAQWFNRCSGIWHPHYRIGLSIRLRLEHVSRLVHCQLGLEHSSAQQALQVLIAVG
jgi:hypothetical protein